MLHMKNKNAFIISVSSVKSRGAILLSCFQPQTLVPLTHLILYTAQSITVQRGTVVQRQIPNQNALWWLLYFFALLTWDVPPLTHIDMKRVLPRDGNLWSSSVWRLWRLSAAAPRHVTERSLATGAFLTFMLPRQSRRKAQKSPAL